MTETLTRALQIRTLAEYVYNQDVGFLVEAEEKHKEYIYVILNFDTESGQVTNVTYFNSWDGQQVKDAIIYPLAELIELSPYVWEQVEQLNRDEIDAQ